MADAQYLTVDHLNTAELTRIFSKIVVDPVNGCWLWKAGKTKAGYGKIKFLRRHETTHRVIYAWLVEPLPRGKGRDIPDLDHIVCDTTGCCFPAHLKLGPPRDNTLRSNNPFAKNARKTHCPRGHELPTEPHTLEGRPSRTCMICREAWHKSERYKKWNADFGRAYYQKRRNGPDGEAFLEHRRAVTRAWIARKRAERHSGHDPKE